MERLFPTKGLNPRKYNLVRERGKLIDALNRILPKYGINNFKRVTAFLGNCGIETDYFRTTEEYASGWDYDVSQNPAKAKKLGNYKFGDGPKYKGGGLTQTTGGYNYGELNKSIGKKLGVDFKKNPELLRENIEIAVESACIFWDDHKLNAYADSGEFKKLSAIVNRGDENLIPLHWAKRNELYSLCKRVVPQDFFLDEMKPASIVSAPPTAAVDQPVENGAVDTANTLALTPTDNSQPAVEQKSKVKEFSEKYLKHCPQDTVKNILGVIAGRILSGITTLWAFGLSGKIFLIAVSIIAVGCCIYALYYYSTRIFGWLQDLADSLILIR
jgi:putative chitinase